ncbi:hypothetical protein [Arthrobacter sunyaminii]|uniref:hypothetical protein n=1 Tax=Arthrobacter sunyaminii TaxID=2816859 RepID=UPI001A93EE92|nr:hypothetical protein [Arthrobacter sunyaminii]MBO0895374.1 hypothetical protein [Arthrobacter sunyaminii]
MANRSSPLPRRRKALRPAQTVFLGFLAVDAAGTVLLLLPAATRDPGGAPFMAAFFTATSSLCVTGLGVEGDKPDLARIPSVIRGVLKITL